MDDGRVHTTSSFLRFGVYFIIYFALSRVLICLYTLFAFFSSYLAFKVGGLSVWDNRSKAASL